MPVPCARCDSPLPLWELSSAGAAVCTSCGSSNTVRVFPALFAAPEAPALPEGALEGEAACFDHPTKRAVADCQQCGRFVCQLCAVDFGGQIWCPSCVAAGRGRSKAVYLEPSRTLYDSIAIAVPLATLIVWPLTILTGPGTVVFSAMTWKRPLSLVRKSRWRFVAACVIGLAETVGWIWLAVYWWEQLRMGVNGVR
ncbi:MAG TPA: hypothetical protein VHW09_26145 [Bryobacteraceae bacterium]|jgi:hypothetical protein|nr:hypothetical protein [Bryobacteraceae bacterium]